MQKYVKSDNMSSIKTMFYSIQSINYFIIDKLIKLAIIRIIGCGRINIHQKIYFIAFQY